MNRVEAFNEHRTLLFSISYRMLGSVMDAEDMVQETFLRWQRARDDEVRSPKSYLSTVVTRLCIDQQRSARARREQYVGPWLPEPIVTEELPGPDEQLVLADSLSMAFLVLLESLSPTERAVFLLREVFDYAYPEVARIVDKSEANCRQMVRRARQHIKERRPRFDASREQAAQITERFLQAAQTGDMDGLLDLLAEDVTLWSDGGGKVAAALNPIYGASNVARLSIALAQTRQTGFASRLLQVNGLPGVVIYQNGQPEAVIGAEIENGKIRAMRIVVNPEKLRSVPPLAQ
ncbi:MAG: RNA polymerase sigma-70 factor [Dehalococcoidia bacterium]